MWIRNEHKVDNISANISWELSAEFTRYHHHEDVYLHKLGRIGIPINNGAKISQRLLTVR